MLNEDTLTNNPARRFSTVGPVAHVLHEAQRRLPEIFGPQGKAGLPSLEKLLCHYAPNQKWTTVVLSVTSGTARHELINLLAHPCGHMGPIIIDPDLCVPGHHIYKSEDHARIHLERLIGANEARNGLLAIIYVVNNFTHELDLKYETHHTRRPTPTQEQMAEIQEDENARPIFYWARSEPDLHGRHQHGQAQHPKPTALHTSPPELKLED